MRIAFVRRSSRLNSPETLNLLLDKLSAAGIQYDVVPWDKSDVDWKLYSQVILTSQISYDKRLDEFLQWVHRMEELNSTKLWNTPSTIKWNSNKKYLLELESKGIKLPATVYLHKDQIAIVDIAEIILNGLAKYEKPIKEIVIKNSVSAAGRLVWRTKLTEKADGTMEIESSAIKKIQEQLFSHEGRYGVLVQEFLPNIFKEGEWSLVYFNKMFSHAVIKKPPHMVNDGHKGFVSDNAEFRIQARYGGYSEVIPEIPANLISFGNCVLLAVPDPLLHARVDIIMGEDGLPCLLELEVLDMHLFITNPVHADKYFKAIMDLSKL